MSGWLTSSTRPPFGRGPAGGLPDPRLSDEFLVIVVPLAPPGHLRRRLGAIRLSDGRWLRVVGLADEWRSAWRTRLEPYRLLVVHEGDAVSRRVIAAAHRDLPDADVLVLAPSVTLAGVHRRGGAEAIRSLLEARARLANDTRNLFVAGDPETLAAWERDLGVG